LTSLESSSGTLSDGGGQRDPLAISKPQIIHVASLGITLETFVIPLLDGPLQDTYEHVLISSTDSPDVGASSKQLALGRSKSSILHSWIFARRNYLVLSKTSPTAVHIHTPATAIALLPTLRRLKRRGIKPLYTARGSFDESGSVIQRVIWRLVDPLKWKLWDGVCVTNDYLESVSAGTDSRIGMKISFGATVPKAPRIKLSDDEITYWDGQNSLNLVWMGRFDRDKRLEDFIEIVRRLDKQVPGGCRGHVLGCELPGDTRKAISDPTLITFYGWVKDPFPTLSQCDLLISTSVREGFGLGPIEAAIVGTPSIALSNHGTRESVPLVGGTLLGRPCIEEIQSAILRHTQESMMIRLQNRDTVQRLAQEAVASSNSTSQLFDFYSAIMAR